MAEEVAVGKWKIKAFETSRGEKPVEKFIYTQSSQTIAKITRTINLLESHGSMLGMPHSRKLSGQVYELRIRGKQEIRILYTFKGGVAYLVHAFKKQTQQIPARELSIAANRLTSI